MVCTASLSCGFLIAPCLVIIAFTQMKKIPDNSPEAQDLQDLTIQYEFSENYHYAKIERDFVLAGGEVPAGE